MLSFPWECRCPPEDGDGRAKSGHDGWGRSLCGPARYGELS